MTARETEAEPTLPPGEVLLARIAPAVFLMFWASGFAVGKVGLRHAEPLTFLAIRFGIIALVLAPIFLILRPKAPARRIDWLHIAVIGFLMQTVYFGMAYAGMSLGVSAGVAAVLAATQPLVVALAAPIVTGERVGPLRWLGLVIGAAGAVMVVAATASFGAAMDFGLLLCFGSMLGMSAATLYQKRFPVTAHPVTVNLVHYTVGVATIAPLALATESLRVDWTGEFIAALGWLVVANSLISVALLLFMIRRGEAARVSALFFLVPPIAALYGWALLGETLAPLALLGMAVAAVGVALVSRAR
jgi:drug/metabolite transporter (DMT)-like permease